MSAGEARPRPARRNRALSRRFAPDGDGCTGRDRLPDNPSRPVSRSRCKGATHEPATIAISVAPIASSCLVIGYVKMARSSPGPCIAPFRAFGPADAAGVLNSRSTVIEDAIEEILAMTDEAFFFECDLCEWGGFPARLCDGLKCPGCGRAPARYRKADSTYCYLHRQRMSSRYAMVGRDINIGFPTRGSWRSKILPPPAPQARSNCRIARAAKPPIADGLRNNSLPAIATVA